MGRGLRVSIPGGIYHVFQRGNNKEYIFADDEDKLRFMKLLLEHLDKEQFSLLGYVIMSNHYHLIIQLDETLMQGFMHHILCNYARNYNKRKGRSGHVFEGRYQSRYVSNRKYLFDLLRYVHQNPLRAGICRQVSTYTWSSDHFYRTQNDNSFVNISVVLDSISEDRSESHEVYLELMEQSTDKGIREFEHIAVIGDKMKSLDALLKECCEDESILEQIKSQSRCPSLSQYKQSFIKAATENAYSLKEISEHICISQSAISKMLKSMPQ